MSNITVQFDRSAGVIRPLHGVNNGPIGFGDMVDVSHYFKELAIPYCRLHDSNWPNPREVDIPRVFPDFDADVGDPASYCFEATDTYIQRILDTGARIIYRLGTSIEGTKRKYFTHPPKDVQKWAQICRHVVRHYNEGWANGFHHGIEYWEIWNEPDLGANMWSGTPEQYFDLYTATARLLKQHFPTVKIGGYGVAHLTGPMLRDFLACCRQRQLPLDFLTWHSYDPSPETFARLARFARALLDEHGFQKTESHFNEWNYRDFDWATIFQKENEHHRHGAFERQKNEVGASFVAACLIMMQDEPIDIANYYDGQPHSMFCGLFHPYGTPAKTYYGMKAFRQLLNYPERVPATKPADNNRLYCLAAVNRPTQEAAVLLSHFDGTPGNFTVSLRGLPMTEAPTAEVFVLDQYRNLECVRSVRLDVMDPSLTVWLDRYTVTLVKLHPEK